MKRVAVALALALSCILCGCTSLGALFGAGQSGAGFETISQDEAKSMMADDEVVIVDVRTLQEYNTGHIPGAICIPNEEIDASVVEKLPDPDQKILVYCRTGRRSKEAALKLADLGYTHVYDFGGITSWTGETTTD